MNNFNEIKSHILKIISNSPLPEDLPHAKNTLHWLLKVYPKADFQLKIAALGHDIERAVPERLKRENFNNYDEFKKAHALRSAKILKNILLNFNLSDNIIQNIFNIVKNHEHGGDFYSNILKDADSLSFFDVNIKYLYEREGFEGTLERAIWGYKRLSNLGKKFFKNIDYENDELNLIKEKILKMEFKNGDKNC